VAQPPPAVSAQAEPLAPPAKPARTSYRRNLPHIQAEGKTFFVAFATYKRWQLPPSVRGIVLEHCLDDHGTKLIVHGVVVMPDHVHMVFMPLTDEAGDFFGLAEIMSAIKGASAHCVNKLLRRRGHVWQDESLDHILRSNENVRNKVEYICDNPVRKGLVEAVEDYPWLWREWVEGRDTAEGGCAT